MKRPVIELGLAMAGAASAGAYAAGVLDFLLEALSALEAGKAKGGADFPAHDVKLRAVSGTSAGGLNAALLAMALDGPVAPARGAAKAGESRNSFFSTWVDRVDLAEMLGTTDLKSDKVDALLDSTCLDRIAEAALEFPSGEPRPGFLAETLDLFVTFTNLQGVPYDINLIESQIRQSQPAGYAMTAHADHVRFATGAPRGADAHALDPADRRSPGWRLLRDAALASSAFPGGFSARRLQRPASDYAERRGIPPSWNLAPETMVELLCVDGGALNNEPIDLTRRVLEEEGAGDAHALILIDPFAHPGQFDPGASLPEGLAGLALRLIGALRAQAVFKPEEIVPALERGNTTRFLIAPRRTDEDGTLLAYPLAGGALGGFAGFLDRGFRLHDFMLGRRNAQRFLARHFALPSDHPAVAGWSEAMDRAHGIWPKGVAQRYPAPFRPIIPLMGGARETCPAPAWPKLEPRRLARLERLARRRLAAVLRGLTGQYLGGSLMARLASLALGTQQARAARQAAAYIRRALEERDQMAGRMTRKPAAAPASLAPQKSASAHPRLKLAPRFAKRRGKEPVQTIGWGHSIDLIEPEPEKKAV